MCLNELANYKINCKRIPLAVYNLYYNQNYRRPSKNTVKFIPKADISITTSEDRIHGFDFIYFYFCLIKPFLLSSGSIDGSFPRKAT